MALMVIWIVLMILWLFYGWSVYDPARPRAIGGTILPWLCVLILGLKVFGIFEK